MAYLPNDDDSAYGKPKNLHSHAERMPINNSNYDKQIIACLF